jgi:NADH-quinone oxidoreductase subunit A
VLAPIASAFAVLLAGLAVALVLRTAADVLDRTVPTAPERVPFAGGFPPRVHAWSRFHVRYYAMALVFLAFDMEMVFMYPWAVVFLREGIVALFEMGWFILVLLLGVLYAWRERALRWA